MYAMLCTRPDICFAVGIVSRFQSKPGPDHWTAVKHIFKYLKRTRDSMLVYSRGDLTLVGYTDSDFQSDVDSRKSTSGVVFTIGEEQSYGGVSSNLVMLTPPWKLSMLLHARLFGSASSCWT